MATLDDLDKRDHAFHNLVSFKSVLDELEIPFWLEGGTLLGAVRENNIIVGDERDVDLGCWSEPYASRIPDIISLAQARGWTLRNHWKGDARAPGKAQELAFTIPHHKIDLFFFEVKEELAWACYYKNNVCLPVVVERRFFDNLQPINFREVTFNTPSPVEDYLEYRYGDWRTPISADIYAGYDPSYQRALRPDWVFYE